MKRALDTEGALRFRKGIDFADGDILGAREIQEDYALFRAGPSGAELLAVLADGMGGHTGGEVASKMAVDAFVATFNAYPAGSVPVKLGAALNEANNHLASGIKNAPALDGSRVVGYCDGWLRLSKPEADCRFMDFATVAECENTSSGACYTQGCSDSN